MEVIENFILVSMDVTNLYKHSTGGRQNYHLQSYEHFHNKPSIPTYFLTDLLRLVQDKAPLSLMESVIYKHREPLWVLNWQYLLPTHLWQWLRQKS